MACDDKFLAAGSYRTIAPLMHSHSLWRLLHGAQGHGRSVMLVHGQTSIGLTAVLASRAPQSAARSVKTEIHKRGRNFSPQAIETIRRLIDQGKSVPEIATAIGSTPASVRVKLSRLKIKLPRKKLPRRPREPRYTIEQRLIVYVQPDARAALEAKASQMHESASRLSARLLEAIVGSNLYEAVLDEEGSAAFATSTLRCSDGD